MTAPDTITQLVAEAEQRGEHQLAAELRRWLFDVVAFDARRARADSDREEAS